MQQLGNKNGGTPVLLLPDDKGRRRGGEQPEQAELRGGWRCEGGQDFSSKMPRLDKITFKLLFKLLVAGLICSVKQTPAIVAGRKVKVIK